MYDDDIEIDPTFREERERLEQERQLRERIRREEEIRLEVRRELESRERLRSLAEREAWDDGEPQEVVWTQGAPHAGAAAEPEHSGSGEADVRTEVPWFTEEEAQGREPEPERMSGPAAAHDARPGGPAGVAQEDSAPAQEPVRTKGRSGAVPRTAALGQPRSGGESAARAGSATDSAAGDAEGVRPRGGKRRSLIGGIISGNILSREAVQRRYPYMLFVALLGIVYIYNVFYMQQLYRRQARLTREVKELRTEAMALSSVRMQATRQSSIVREVKARGLGLEESVTPVKVIEKK